MDPNNENPNHAPAVVPEAPVNPFAERAAVIPTPRAEKGEPLPIAITEGGLRLTNYNEAKQTAALLFASKLIPPGFRTVEQVLVAILRAVELKLPPFQALEGMTVINGRVGIMGDLALAMVESSGLLERKKVVYTGEGDEMACTVSLKRKGREGNSYSFSVKEAKMAGIFNRSTVWQSYPKRMTYYRALGFGLRDEFADVLRGVKTIEELQDYPEKETAS
jgi:hypothetical protein